MFTKNFKFSYPNNSSFTEFVDGLSRVHKQIDKEYNASEYEYYCNVDFKEYFKIFDKLSVAPNWKLESHYFQNTAGGRPLLFAFEKGDMIGDRLYQELVESSDPESSFRRISSKLEDELFNYSRSINYMHSIEIADNPMGYFQFLVFDLIGNNYCLHWHSNYSEMDIITSQKQLLKLTKRKNHPYYKFSQKDKNSPPPTEPQPNEINLRSYTMDIDSVLQIDPTPIITMGEDSVEVRIVTLGPWQGFISRTFHISKAFPHIIEEVKSDTLVPYDCGITF